MKILMSVGVILALLTISLGHEKGDDDQLGKKVSSQLESRLPGWRQKRTEPFGPSRDIVVQFWCTTNRVVKISIAIRETVDDAKKEVRSFLQFNREPQKLSGFGDEAFAPEPNGYNIVLRRGRYVIYVSVVIFPDSDPEALTLSPAERDARLRSEADRVLKEFAKQLSLIDLP